MVEKTMLSAEAVHTLKMRVMDRVRETHQQLVDALMQDGMPPLHRPAREREQWETLNAMRAANDPRFFSNPEAIRDYERLAKQFGAPPAPPVAPPASPSPAPTSPQPPL